MMSDFGGVGGQAKSDKIGQGGGQKTSKNVGHHLCRFPKPKDYFRGVSLGTPKDCFRGVSRNSSF